jgi:homocysteine S-methyltransferase
MLSKKELDDVLTARGTLILDGALATELEARGHDLNHPLWSAKILKDDPASIEEVHYDYYLAGADVAITASYQAATLGLTDHFDMDEEEGKDLIKRSVHVAQSARAKAYDNGVDASLKLLVAGSVGPYGAYLSDGSEYRGDYIRTEKEFQDFHRPRIQALIDAGADLLAVETIPSMLEIQAILSLLQSDFPNAVAWLSCTAHSAEALCDQTPWEEVLRLLDGHRDQIIGFGINCVPMAMANATLEYLSKLTTLGLVCYPNSGEIWDAVTKTWHGERPDEGLTSEQSAKNDKALAHEFRQWTQNGAKMIGGCCRCGPAFVKAMSKTLEIQSVR